MQENKAVRGIVPDWPVPARVQAFSSIRTGGVSRGAYRSLNLATHVGDDPGAVADNRARLLGSLGLSDTPLWLQQVHGTRVIEPGRDDVNDRVPEADGAVTSLHGTVCAVMTADCLPVLFCDRAGSRVAAAHAGWRGLSAGILESVLGKFADPAQLLAWLGPAIGPKAFEVGTEVREAFCDVIPESADAFVATDQSRWLADIYELARLRLQKAGVSQIYGGGACTFSDAGRFFSYRRDRHTGRMATLIWISDRDD